MTLLDVAGLTVRHGGLVALADVDLDLDEGQIVGLIGPNGAGKTTFIDTLTGFTSPLRGTITFDGRDITRASAHARSKAGLVRTFQSLELFDDLTVLDNLLVAAHTPSLWDTLTDALWPKVHDNRDTHTVLELLGLVPLADRLPVELSNGQRHMVALGRALVASPKLVLLDEPAAGLDPGETTELAATLRRLSELGTTVLVVDHDMSLILNVCDAVHVLDYGTVVASGPPAVVRRDPRVIAAYLGRQADDGGPG
jgi:branched-chain amino acid transport system ATP-binding protein